MEHRSGLPILRRIAWTQKFRRIVRFLRRAAFRILDLTYRCTRLQSRKMTASTSPSTPYCMLTERDTNRRKEDASIADGIGRSSFSWSLDHGKFPDSDF